MRALSVNKVFRTQTSLMCHQHKAEIYAGTQREQSVQNSDKPNVSNIRQRSMRALSVNKVSRTQTSLMCHQHKAEIYAGTQCEQSLQNSEKPNVSST